MLQEGIEDFLDFIRDVEQGNRISLEEERISNNETQDLLHMLELLPMDDSGLLSVSQHLIESRKKRREAKNYIAAGTLIVEWIEENRAVIKSLERLLGEVRKKEQSSEGRLYTPRTSVWADIIKESDTTKEVKQHG